MALETLKGIKEIDGFEITQLDEKCSEDDVKAGLGKKNFILVNHKTNTIAFTIQKGAIKEVGRNGCQVDTIIKAALSIIEGLNKKYPCKENKKAMKSLGDALIALTMRKIDRIDRDVEGLEKP